MNQWIQSKTKRSSLTQCKNYSVETTSHLVLLISCRYLIKRHQFKCTSSETKKKKIKIKAKLSGWHLLLFHTKYEKSIDNNVNVVAIEKRFNFNNPDVYIMQKVLFAFKFNNQHSIWWEYLFLSLEFLMRNQKQKRKLVFFLIIV